LRRFVFCDYRLFENCTKKALEQSPGLQSHIYVLASTAFCCVQEAVVACLGVLDDVYSHDACNSEPLLGTHTTHTHWETIHLHYY
jgi:hypothetical protein